MESLFNPKRESHKEHSKKIHKIFDDIAKWIETVEGKNPDTALDFLERYLFALNQNTLKSMFDEVLSITKTEFIEVNKREDLHKLLRDLCIKKQEIKSL